MDTCLKTGRLCLPVPERHGRFVLKSPLLMETLRLTNSRLPPDSKLPAAHVQVVKPCLGTIIEAEGLPVPSKGREGEFIKPVLQGLKCVKMPTTLI